MIATERLLLRSWCASDAAPFLAMCNDPAVMEYLGDPMDEAQVAEAMARQNGFIDQLGHGFWAMERRADEAFLGFCGIKPGAVGTPVEGRPEIGWRLAYNHWGQGYAREAAQACLDWGWEHLADDIIWAITVHGNARSWGLMERLGMQRQTALDFDHPQPGLAERLRPHVTYNIERPQ